MCELRINFYPFRVLDAPGWLLGDINYSRPHYGLGYKSTLGKSKKYWLETLARELRKARGNDEQLLRIIQDLEENASGDDARKARVTNKLVQNWRSIETVINSQLLVALTLFPNSMRTEIFQNLFPEILSYRSTAIQTAGVYPNYIEPDLFAQLGDNLMMIELKAKAKYKIKQHISYLRFVSAYRQLHQEVDQTNILHLILQPAQNLDRIHQHENWIEAHNQETGKLDINAQALQEYWDNNKFRKGPLFDEGELVKLSNELPVYLKSWRQLADAVDHVVNNNNLGAYQEPIELLAQQMREMCEHASGNFW